MSQQQQLSIPKSNTLFIEGVAIDTSVNANKWQIPEEDLDFFASSLFGAQLRVDHSESAFLIVGRVLKSQRQGDRVLFQAEVADEKIIEKIETCGIKDAIILLRLKGKLMQGKTSDIDFQKIQEKIKEKGAYVLLKNTSRLKTEETEIEIRTDNLDELENSIISDFAEKNPSQFNSFISPLLNSFALEKQEDEKSSVFESRLLNEINKVLEVK